MCHSILLTFAMETMIEGEWFKCIYYTLTQGLGCLPLSIIASNCNLSNEIKDGLLIQNNDSSSEQCL